MDALLGSFFFMASSLENGSILQPRSIAPEVGKEGAGPNNKQTSNDTGVRHAVLFISVLTKLIIIVVIILHTRLLLPPNALRRFRRHSQTRFYVCICLVVCWLTSQLNKLRISVRGVPWYLVGSSKEAFAEPYYRMCAALDTPRFWSKKSAGGGPVVSCSRNSGGLCSSTVTYCTPHFIPPVNLFFNRD